jgi:hypothetical protein
LGLETHVQHAISLIKDQVLDVAQGDTATLDQIDETTGGSNQQITAALDLAELGANIGTTVNDTWADPGSVGELARLVKDLRDKLTGGSKDQGGGISLALASKASSGSSRWCGWASQESLRQDGEQETTSLSGTGLGTSHQVTATHNNGNGVFLDGGGNFVVSELNVLQQVLVERGVGELEDRLRDIVSRGLDWNIIILLEVDTGLLFGGVIQDAEELTLKTWVGRAGDVFALSPLSVTAATGSSSTSRSWVAVSVLVEAALRTVPATWASATRSEVGGVGVSPVATRAWAIACETVGSVCQ